MRAKGLPLKSCTAALICKVLFADSGALIFFEIPYAGLEAF
jgi:hypothetical protein